MLPSPLPAAWLAFHAQIRPHALALTDAQRGEALTYQALYQRVVQRSAGLVAAGLQAGDRVAVLADNRIETLVLLFALARHNALLLPLNWRLTVSELQFQLDDTCPRWLFHDDTHATKAAQLTGCPAIAWGSPADADLMSAVATAPALPHPEAPLLLLYTSGTTGQPKGALLSQRMVTANADNTALSWGVSAEDRTVAHAPFFHTGGLNVLTLPLLQRGGVVAVMPRFDAGQVLAAIQARAVTVFFGVPTMYEQLAAHPDFAATDFAPLRFCVSGGAPCPDALIARYQSHGVTLQQGYGLTEAGVNCFAWPRATPAYPSKIVSGKVGYPNWLTRARVVDALGKPVAAGATGELWLAGPTLCSGYWQRPEATAALFCGDWLKTGDLFTVDASGCYTIVDRLKNLFISGGENVYPAELETHLREHPEVVDCAVIGVADDRWGEVGCAFVVLRDDESPPSTQALHNFMATRLARYKLPRHYRFVKSLPLSSTGKVMKPILMAAWQRG